MAAGTISLSYTITSNGATSATVRITMTYYGNGQTWSSSPSSNNCQITLNGTTQYFTHAYTTSTSAQTMGYADFTITKTHSTQSLTASGTITNYSTVYSNPTATCTVSISAKTSYTVSYNGNGNTGGTLPSNQTKWHGESLTLATNSLTRTGYTANAWNTNSSGSGTDYSNGISYTGNANLALYAKWTINSYTLTANANGGSIPSTSGWTGTGATATKSVNYGSTYGTLPTPTRTNYNFLGWFTKQSGGTQVTSGTTIGASSTTIYAQWQQAYVASTVTNISAYRCDLNGNRQDDGSYGTLSFKVSQYSDGSNYSWPTVSAVYGSNNSITLTYGESDNIRTYTPVGNVFGNNNLGDSQYDIKITITDGSYGSRIYNTFISAKKFVIDINQTGTAIGLLTAVDDNATGIYIGGDLNLNSGFKYKYNGVETAANLTPYIRHNRGNLDWTGTNEGDTKAITKSALAYWNGAYDGTNGSNLVYCSKGAFGDVVTSNISQNGILSSSGSVTVDSATTFNICSITVPANSEYIILSTIDADTGPDNLLYNSFNITSGTASASNWKAARGTMSAGGGLTNWAYIKTGSGDITLALVCYGYYTTSHSERGVMVGFPIYTKGLK